MAKVTNPKPEDLAQKAVEHARLAKAGLKDPGLVDLATAIEYLALAVGFGHLALIQRQGDAG